LAAAALAGAFVLAAAVLSFAGAVAALSGIAHAIVATRHTVSVAPRTRPVRKNWVGRTEFMNLSNRFE
jgi:hypothetical protein